MITKDIPQVKSPHCNYQRIASLKKQYDGKRIVAYCCNGTAVRGVAHFLEDSWVSAKNPKRNDLLSFNLDYVVSITDVPE